MKPVLKPFASAFAALAAVVTIAIVASLSSGAASAGVSTADAALDKAPTNQTVNFGDTIEWSITVTNVGTGDVGPFHLEDTLPANGTGISWDLTPVGWDTCSPDPATTNFTCDRAEALHEGESITLTISGNSGDLESCPEGTQVVLVNNAGVDAGGDDNAANDGDSAVATVNCPAAPAPGDAALDKAPTNQTVNFGDPIEWTITVTNVGTGDVGPFHLEDTLPANGTGISWDLTPVGWDSCTPDPATANFTCDRAEVLHAGESVTVTITGNSGDLAECPEGTAVELVNNAGVDATGDDNPLNDGDSAVATVNCPAAPSAADAALDKGPVNQSVNFGDPIEWTITVTNVGTGDVGGFHLEDTLPANGTGISWDIEEVGWDLCDPDPATTNFVCDRAETLHEGESITLTITGNSGDLESCPEGTQVVLVNNAGVDAIGDDNPLNDGDSAVATVNCPAAPSAADAELDKEPVNQTVNFGDPIEWTITVTNVGTGDVGGFHLEDTLPANGTGISWDIEEVGWDLCDPDPATTNFVCDRAETLHEGESITLTITGNSGDLESCPEGTQVVLVNNAGVDSIGDDNPLNDGDSAVATVNCPAVEGADAELDKEALFTTVDHGENVTYTITVTNVGSGDVGGFTLTDSLPGGGAISWTLTPVGWDDCSPNPATTTFTCTRAETLHEGESVTVTIFGNTSGLECLGEDIILTNEASVVSVGDTDAGNDSDSATTTVTCPALADAALEKTPPTQTVDFGESIQWMITVTNVGSGDVGGFTLTDNLPGGGAISWTLTPVGWDNCSPNPATTTFTCTRAETLHEGESVTVIITGNSGDLGSCPVGEQVILTDEATVVSIGDANSANDSDSAEATVVCPAAEAADAALDKSPPTQTVELGEPITWVITVTNVGTGDVGGFTLTDTLPVNGTGISWNLTPVGWDSCTPDPATTTFTCTRAETLHEGEAITVAITGDTDDLECPEGTEVILTDSAIVDATGDDNTANDADSAEATVNCPTPGVADAALEKTPPTQTVDFGETIQWTITVTNVGSGDVGGFTLTDTLPINGTGISWDLDPVGWDDCSPDPASMTFTCTRGETLHEGESVTVIITGNSGDLGSCPVGEQVILTDEATVVSTGDLNTANDTDTAEATVVCPPAEAADAALDKSPPTQTVEFGEPITWVITVTNVGTGDVGGFTLTDTLPVNGTGISWNLTPVGWDSCTPDPATTTFTCTRAETLHEGEAVTVAITGDTDDFECPEGTQVTLTDTALVDATGDDNTANDEDTAEATVNCPAPEVADAALEKTPPTQTVDFGETIQWTITVTNVGSGDVGGFTLTDALPINGTGISWDLDPVGWDDCSPDPASMTFTCTRAETLHEGESVTVVITGNSGDLASCPVGEQVILTDEATVVSIGDANTANDSDSAEATVVCPPAEAADAALDKSPPTQTVEFGEPITWVITVTNVGTGDVGGFTLTDTLPVNGTGISWNLTPVGWDSCTPDPATTTFTCTRAETLHEGEAITVAITGDTDDLECPEGTQVILTDSAVVDATGDDNTANDADSAEATVNCPDVGGAGAAGSGDGGTGTGGQVVSQPGQTSSGGATAGSTSNVAGARGASSSPRIDAGGTGIAGVDDSDVWQIGLASLLAVMVASSFVGCRRAVG